MKLNEEVVKSLPAPTSGNRITYFADATLQGARAPRGFGVRVTAAGIRSFVMNYRVAGVERRITIGQHPDWSVLRAVKQARELRQRIDLGEDPLAARRKAAADAHNTFKAIAEDYFKREGGKLRSGELRRHTVERLAYPAIGGEDIGAIKRSDLVRMLDTVEDENGPVMATRLLAYVGKIFNWHASRSDDFRSPIVRGMARSNGKERARARTLDDDELRAVWRAAEASGTHFGRLVRFILLTGARRSEAALMACSELKGRDWTLPAARNKVKVDLLRPLSAQAFALLPAGGGERVFETVRNTHWPLMALHKASGTRGWTLHDCRRTSRTLMSRAGINSDVAEQCLGHLLPGIRAVYDQHKYAEEKAAAYVALADLIARIVATQIY